MESSPRSAINRKNEVQAFCTVADIWVCLHLLVYAYTRLCMPTLACVHPEGFWEATYGHCSLREGTKDGEEEEWL